MKLIQTKDYLLFIDEKAEIKGTVCLCYNSIKNTWDEDIILHQGAMPEYHFIGFQKIIAYYPLTKEAKKLNLPLLPPFEKVDIEKLVSNSTIHIPTNQDDRELINCRNFYREGYKAAQSKQLELLKRAIQLASDAENIEEVEQEILQSLFTQQLPKEFMPEYNVHMEAMDMPRIHIQKEVKTLKTITNSEGKEELIGTYKY